VSAPTQVDLIVETGAMLPMTGTDVVYDALVAVDDGKIVYAGEAAGTDERYTSERVIREPDSVMLPGFVDTHTHVGAHVFGTVCDDENVITSLYRLWFPMEHRLDDEIMYAASRLGLWDAVRSGTTTVANDQYFADATARAVDSLGARALVATEINEFSREQEIEYDAETRSFRITYDRGKAEDLLAQNIELVERWRSHPRVRPVLGPHAPDLLSTEMLVRCAEEAERLDTKMLIHVAQSEAELACVRERDGQPGSIHFLDSIGFLSPRVQAAHMVWLSDEEIDIAAASGMGMSWTPTIMMSCGSYARVDRLVPSGIRMGFGTDCFGMDVLEELRYALYSANYVRGGDGFRMNAYDLVSMATVGGARCLGLDDVGTLEAGKRADLIVLNLRDAQLVPNTSYFETIAYRAKSRDVTHTIVDGQVVYADGRLQLADQDEIFEEGTRAASEWLRRSADVLGATGVLDRFHPRARAAAAARV
jgi:5-methylthioadenosine/S-adenosylhomocysteine deaminase